MLRIRMTTRRWMVVIALLAPAFAAVAWVLQVGRSLDNLYGPGGILDTEHRLSLEWSAADACLEQGRPIQAEAHYRSALALVDRLQTLRRRPGTPPASLLAGLAETLAAQGRDDEAEAVYTAAVSIAEDSPRHDRAPVQFVEPLERFAAFLRRSGRNSEAIVLEDRALAILDRSSAAFRRDGEEAHATRIEARAGAIRAARLGSSAVP